MFNKKQFNNDTGFKSDIYVPLSDIKSRIDFEPCFSSKPLPQLSTSRVLEMLWG